jgi:hypothetical protein
MNLESRDLPEAAPDEVEGLDIVPSDGWGDYPLDAVFVRTETRTVSHVVKRINNQRYVLDPDFQRDFVWLPQKQSKLIESCVMRIPLPVFYVAEAPDGRIIVVDGLQRLTTFVRFLGNQLKLHGLTSGEGNTDSHALEGKSFEGLPLNLQERVQDTQLTMYILDAKAPERARLDIFERVNSGEPLTRQQMRNALYNGPATVWLREAAEGAAFKAATGQGLSAKKMRDREAINRFCAFKLLGWRRYTAGDMDAFLADGLRELAAETNEERDQLRAVFDRAMNLNRKLFGDKAFRRSLGLDPMYPRGVINISLFDVCAVTMSEERVLSCRQDSEHRLRDAIVDLVRNSRFQAAITYSTNSTAAVRERYQGMEAAINEAVHQC